MVRGQSHKVSIGLLVLHNYPRSTSFLINREAIYMHIFASVLCEVIHIYLFPVSGPFYHSLAEKRKISNGNNF